MPSADFCAAVRAPCGSLSPPSFPEGHSTDLLGKPRSLPRAPAGFTARPLMDMDFATSCPLVRPMGRLISGCCSSDRDFAPRFLQTVPRGSALALHSCFTSIRLHRGLSPPGCWTCPAHRTLRAAQARWPAAILDRDGARRPAVVRPGRRNSHFQPNQETSRGGIAP